MASPPVLLADKFVRYALYCPRKGHERLQKTIFRHFTDKYSANSAYSLLTEQQFSQDESYSLYSQKRANFMKVWGVASEDVGSRESCR